MPSTDAPAPPSDAILDAVRRYWGYTSLRPLQQEAIAAGIARRDALVVLPTGGGKSLCYQTPPLVADRVDVVVSPLISLMKDQVDGLRECGYPAVALHSGMPLDALRDAENALLTRRVRLAFVAPERLLTDRFLALVRRAGVCSFAIDEAHCISHWGHDFRPEYRRLARLKELFPEACIHAYTATATRRVRDDIVAQLGLRAATVLVGVFDRPNLIYRILPLLDREQQVADILARHRNEAAIIYCNSRRETESLCQKLLQRRLRAAYYHAGLDPDVRRRTQEAFADEKLDVIVATVAFGMGIDRSDVRCVIHAAMPKSIEHYQQETGRAGRDGLPAECTLLYSAGDAIRWKRVLELQAEENQSSPDALAVALQLMDEIRRLCSLPRCRHRALSEYFGQTYERENCEACDVCLGEVERGDDGTVLAQKILSCVARVQQRFGAGHVVDVLSGASTERVRMYQHDRLSTYGLVRDMDKKALLNRVQQLVDQGLLDRNGDDRPVLTLNAASWRVMRGEQPVYFAVQKRAPAAPTSLDRKSWEGVDRELFEALRGLRRTLAESRGVPPFLILSDATLRDLARRRPATRTELRGVYGMGEKKCEEFGYAFLEAIRAHGR
jgi:ATP-dependent DNA helicase RecQ